MVRLTPCSRLRARTEGKRSPGPYNPCSMRLLMYSARFRYRVMRGTVATHLSYKKLQISLFLKIFQGEKAICTEKNHPSCTYKTVIAFGKMARIALYWLFLNTVAAQFRVPPGNV
ncbi:hypothetical protein EMIT0P201_12676 [Pseudomonas chlororaphis]